MNGDLSAYLPKSFGRKRAPSSKPNKEKAKEKEDLLSSFLPTSFGKKRRPQATKPVKESPTKKPRTNESDLNPSNPEFVPPTKPESNSTLPTPTNPSPVTVKKTINHPLPISDCVQLKAHKGAVISLDVDPSGSRLLSGATDYLVHFWDFAGMMSDFRSFRNKEIVEGHPVVDIKWNGTGSEFLVSTASLNATIFNRDGILKSEFVKGDPYILDMQHTKGHVAAICSTSWDCEDYGKFVTASQDSTVRIWDVTRTDRQAQIIKAKNQKNTRVQITAMSTSPWESSKNLIAAACMDGSIQIWPMNGPYRVPSLLLRSAHANFSETSDVKLSRDGRFLVSRGGDDTMKIWDLRNISKPLAAFSGLENAFQQTNVCFSPNEKLVVTGTSVRPGSGEFGKLKFFNMEGEIEEYHEIDVCQNSVISLCWHDKLNQIMVGCGDNIVRVYYSNTLSHNGVLMGRDKDPKKKKIHGVVDDKLIPIQNPNSLDLFRDAPSSKRQKLKDRRDPKKSKKPDLPVVTGTKGHSGQVGSGLSQHLVQNMIIRKQEVKDPREALLQYHDKAAAEPLFFGDAYKATQPKTLYSENQEEEEDD